MPKSFSKWLVPEPKGFDDPLKQSAAYVERKWELAAAALGAGAGGTTAAVAAGIAIPPLAPILAAGAAISVFAKLRAKWLKDDPPRMDFGSSAVLRDRQVDFFPLLIGTADPPAGLLPYLSLFEACGRHLEATVNAMEKTLGAVEAARSGDDGAGEFVTARAEEAKSHALSAALVLEAFGASAHDVVHYARQWDWLERLRPRPIPFLWGEISEAEIGALLAAGAEEDWLKAPFYDDGFDGEEISPERIPMTLGRAGRAASVLAGDLNRWASEN